MPTRKRVGSLTGFTVIELMMVVGIITILTGVFLLQQRQFDSTTLLRSLAYRTALTIREAQTYGASVRFAGSGTSYLPAPAYGIYITGTSGVTQYYLFADANGDRVRTSASEDIETFTLNGGYTISEYCATTAGVTPVEKCSSDSAITSLTILFIRPSTDACFETSAGLTTCRAGDTGEDYREASIQLSSPSETVRRITITNTGQISVGAPGS